LAQPLIGSARNATTSFLTPGASIGRLSGAVGPRVAYCGYVCTAAIVWWPAAVPIAAMVVVNEWQIPNANARILSTGRHQIDLSRATYFRDLATSGPSMQELQVFGLGGWIGLQYEAALRDARRAIASVRVYPTLLATLAFDGAMTAITFALILNGLSTGGLGTGAFAALMLAVLAMRPKLDASDYIIKLGADVLQKMSNLEHLSRQSEAASSGLGVEGTGPASPGTKLTSLDEVRFQDAIRFERVSFRYPGAHSDVLSNLELELRLGETLAIVGLNGAGKSTLVKLLAGFYRPTTGRITVDGLDLGEIPGRAWFPSLSILFQDFAHYQLAASTNIRMQHTDRLQPTDIEDLNSLADAIGLKRYIDGLPRGWDTILSAEYSGGIEPSGGQWQKIALARALYAMQRGSRVLILDEPTANLDIRAEAAFFDLVIRKATPIMRGQCLRMVISHRLSTVRQADRILVLDQGLIVEDGSHDQLLKAGALYSRLFLAQAEAYGGTD
jgi:ATP-binding cassette subfamily B protein